MAYQSRRRNYQSRREKLEKSTRNTKVTLFFAAIALIVYLIMTRHEWIGWLKTFTY